MKKLIVVLAFLILTVPLSAEVLGKAQTSASLKLCKESRSGRLAVVDNGVGENPYTVVCKDTSGLGDWEWVQVGGTGDVLLAGDADGQTIQGRTAATSPRLQLAVSSATLGTLISGNIAGPYSKFSFNSFNDDEIPEFQLKNLIGNYSAGLTCGANYCSVAAANGAGDNGTLIVNSGEAYISGTTFSRVGDGSGDLILLSPAAVPSTASDPCTEGETVFSSTFIYRCIATDTWVRAPMGTWETP